jgi:glycosyltransferase 2 family protein
LKKVIFSILQYLFFLFIGLGLLYLVFRGIDLSLVLAEIRTINYFWIGLLFIAGFISHLARAIRWNIMIESMGYKTNTTRTFYAVMVGYLANTAVPRLGEITRCGVMSKSEKIPLNSLIGSVISERAFDMLVLIVMTFLIVIFQLKLVGGFVGKYLLNPLNSVFAAHSQMLLFLCILVLLSIFLLILLRKKISVYLQKFKLYNKINGLIHGFVHGIVSITKIQHKVKFLALTLIIWLMYFMMTYLTFFALKSTSHLTWIDGLTVLAIGSFGFVAPVPGGIGAFHFIVTAILIELYKIAPAPAASFATICHFFQTLLVIVLGSYSYLMIFLFKRKTNHATT